MTALEEERNARQATIDWQFSNKQARVKLKKLYPAIPVVRVPALTQAAPYQRPRRCDKVRRAHG